MNYTTDSAGQPLFGTRAAIAEAIGTTDRRTLALAEALIHATHVTTDRLDAATLHDAARQAMSEAVALLQAQQLAAVCHTHQVEVPGWASHGPSLYRPGTVWHGIPARHSFTCADCAGTILHGGGHRTGDGREQLCTQCHRTRSAVSWAARPAGVYAINVCDHTGATLATSYVRVGRRPAPTDRPAPPSPESAEPTG